MSEHVIRWAGEVQQARCYWCRAEFVGRRGLRLAVLLNGELHPVCSVCGEQKAPHLASAPHDARPGAEQENPVPLLSAWLANAAIEQSWQPSVRALSSPTLQALQDDRAVLEAARRLRDAIAISLSERTSRLPLRKEVRGCLGWAIRILFDGEAGGLNLAETETVLRWLQTSGSDEEASWEAAELLQKLEDTLNDVPVRPAALDAGAVLRPELASLIGPLVAALQSLPGDGMGAVVAGTVRNRLARSLKETFLGLLGDCGQAVDLSVPHDALTKSFEPARHWPATIALCVHALVPARLPSEELTAAISKLRALFSDSALGDEVENFLDWKARTHQAARDALAAQQTAVAEGRGAVKARHKGHLNREGRFGEAIAEALAKETLLELGLVSLRNIEDVYQSAAAGGGKGRPKLTDQSSVGSLAETRTKSRRDQRPTARFNHRKVARSRGRTDLEEEH